MKIAEVSKRVGLPASTIRYYEKIGLVEPQRRESGRRVFDGKALFTLEFVRLAQTTGFTIEETKSLLAAYGDDSSAAGAWKEMAASKRREIRAKTAELLRMDGILTEMLSCSCVSLTECVEKGAARRKSETGCP